MEGIDVEHGRRVRDAVERRRDELIELVLDFCAIPAENPPGTHLVESQQWIEETLARYQIPATTHYTSQNDGDQRVIRATVGSSGPSIYLHGHYDVVPAFADRQFAPTVDSGAIFGRGAADMKGGLVAMLLGAVVHRDLGGAGRVELVYVPDEETGGAHGSERLVELGLIDATDCVGAIVGEPSYPAIWYAARGAFTLNITVHGRPAHVGLHYTGDSAFERAHAIVTRLLAYRNDVARRRTDLRIEPEAARSSIMLVGGVAQGGTNFNIVPDRYMFTIDRRPNPDEDYDEACRELLDLIQSLGDESELTIDVLQDVKPAMTNVDSSLIRVLEAATFEISGRHPPLAMCPGCLETRIYAELGIPAVAVGPGPIEEMHAPAEHVPIENLLEAAAVYAITLGQLLGREY